MNGPTKLIAGCLAQLLLPNHTGGITSPPLFLIMKKQNDIIKTILEEMEDLMLKRLKEEFPDKRVRNLVEVELGREIVLYYDVN